MNKQAEKVLKIVVIGPESTGKSTLCAALADHFSTVWCREYAREYLLENGTDYRYADLLTIARGQIRLEKDAISQVEKTGGRILFIDTDMQVMKVWCEFVFGRCHQEILDLILERQYDGYLLCKPDLPWVKDELREYPDPETRTTLYHIYRDILINQSIPWFEVSGTDPERTTAAIQWVEQLQVKKRSGIQG
jgi:NadR type nicotinamide-nucleotide adenylyltransferase